MLTQNLVELLRFKTGIHDTGEIESEGEINKWSLEVSILTVVMSQEAIFEAGELAMKNWRGSAGGSDQLESDLCIQSKKG